MTDQAPSQAPSQDSDQDAPPPPPHAVIMKMLSGAWVSQAVSTVARLEVPDLLKAHGPSTAEQLIGEHGLKADPQHLRRLLRACASVGVFTEEADGSFGPTELSEALTADAPLSIKKMAQIFCASWWTLWTGLEDVVRTGNSQPQAFLGMEYWDYCKANPREMKDFGEAMKSNSLNSLKGVMENCDLSAARKVADVGGGFGHLAIALLQKYPDLHAAVVDIPDLIPIAKSQAAGQDPAVLSRLEFVPGNMFESVPAADVYILKHIIHDWHDDDCLKLLRNCHASMDGDGRIICVDAIVPSMGDTDGIPGKFMDLNMMIFNMGLERTVEQWTQLLTEAGFKVISITPLRDSYSTSIIEARKA